jgi:hypothetical protein
LFRDAEAGADLHEKGGNHMFRATGNLGQSHTVVLLLRSLFGGLPRGTIRSIMLRISRYALLVASTLFFTFATAQQQDWKTELPTKLPAMKLTKMSSDGTSVVELGTQMTLKKGNVGLVSGQQHLGTNFYKNGTISPEFPHLISHVVEKGDAHMLNAGDAVWISGVVGRNDGIEVKIVSDVIDGRRFFGSIRFSAAKGTKPDADTISASILDAFAIGPTDTAGPSPQVASGDGSTVVNASRGLSVAGVSLGMTPDEALAALSKFQTWPLLSKRYASIPADVAGSTLNPAAYGFLGTEEDCPRMPRQLIAIIAATSDPVRANAEADIRRMPGQRQRILEQSKCSPWVGEVAGAKSGDDPMKVFVYFSPIPGNERVIAVTMVRQFLKPAPSQAVVDSALSKYHMTPTRDKDIGTSRTLSWRYDLQGDRLIPPTDDNFNASSQSLLSVVSPRNGVGLDVYIQRPYAGTIGSANKDLAEVYSASLFHERDLTKFRAQIKVVMDGIVEQRKKDELDKAKQQLKAPIKF